MSTLRASALLLVSCLALVSCGDSDENPSSERDRTKSPCDLFTMADASSLLDGVKVRELDFVDIVESENGPIPQDERPLAEAAARKICVYGTGPEQFASVQVDRRQFDSVEQFRGAFEETFEILDEPGLAANFEPMNENGITNAGALLNDSGDSLSLSVRGNNVAKADLLEVLAELVDRY